jgi:hypothetical protein
MNTLIKTHVIPSKARDLTLRPKNILFTQIFPLRVQLPNQFIFLFASPSFDLFFSRDSIENVLVAFVVNEAIDLVTLRKTSIPGVTVKPKATFKTVCHAGI